MSAERTLQSVPQGWTEVPLGELVTTVKGKRPPTLGPRDSELTVPYVTIAAMEQGYADTFTDGAGCTLCDSGDILMVWDGARCGLVGKGLSGAVCSTMAKLQHEEIATDYLYYFLTSQYRVINSNPRGVGIPHVEPSILWGLRFPLPPLPEQRRIVCKLEELLTRLDAGVAALERARAQLARYRQAVLRDAFAGKLTAAWREAHRGELEPASALLERIRQERAAAEAQGGRRRRARREPPPLDTSELPALPEGWVWATLGELSWDCGYGTSEKCGYEALGQPVLRIPNIVNGTIDLSDLKYATTPALLSGFEPLAPGDMLIVRTNGSPNLIGRAAMVNERFSSAHFYASYLIRYRIVMPDRLGRWISTIWHAPQVRERVMREAATSAGQYNLSIGKLSKVPLPLPPLAELHAITAEVERCLSLTDDAIESLNKVQHVSTHLRQSILRRAFQGRLVPQDPSDEPAEQLLERIRAQRKRKGGNAT